MDVLAAYKRIAREHHKAMGYPEPFPSERINDPPCPRCGGRLLMGSHAARCGACGARLLVEELRR